MNGVHDMGGMHGFGPVVREENEPVFHAPWEGRVLGLRSAVMRAAQLPGWLSRDVIEHIEPLRYLSMSYYERFLEVAEKLAVAHGLVTAEELDRRTEDFRRGLAELPRRHDQEMVERVRALLVRQPQPEPEGGAPRFAPGETVVVRNINWPGHNRLPRYIRGKHGVVERVNGWYHIEDANAAALGPDPQPVYTVGFAGEEVWGPGCEPNLRVYLELWEGYLQAANGA